VLQRYGAVKYFDLKQHPSTNYIFSYERMLDTKVRAIRALLYHLSAPPLASRSFSLLLGVYRDVTPRQGDTAVYLMFAYARLASILRKAQEERSINVRAALAPHAQDLLLVGQFEPPERALVFELLQLGDVLQGGEERELSARERGLVCLSSSLSLISPFPHRPLPLMIQC